MECGDKEKKTPISLRRRIRNCTEIPRVSLARIDRFDGSVLFRRRHRRRCRGIDFSSIVFTSSTLRMHRFPGYALKVSFIALLGPGATIYPRSLARSHTHLRPEAIRATYTRSLPGDSVYFRNSIPPTGTEVHSRVVHRVTITFLSRSGLSSLNVRRAPMR